MEEKAKLEETLTLIKTVWIFLLMALDLACFYNEYRFPGMREQPLDGEAVFWKAQRVLYFGLLGVGFLADIVQMRVDRKRAFIFLTLSLVLGGLATIAGAYQYRLVSYFF